MIVGAGLSKAVLLRFCTPSIAPPAVLVAGVPGPGLAAGVVCDSARQAKRMGARTKTRANGQYLIGPLTEGLIVDLR